MLLHNDGTNTTNTNYKYYELHPYNTQSHRHAQNPKEPTTPTCSTNDMKSAHQHYLMQSHPTITELQRPSLITLNLNTSSVGL
jgi:hypothetical protein